jgi:SAM-dependent methyltransferase
MTMNPTLLALLACPRCEDGRLQSVEPKCASLRCGACSAEYPVRDGVPELLDDSGLAGSATSDLYSDIWDEYHKAPAKGGGYQAAAGSHTELLEQAAGRPLVQGLWGLDAGCGNGGNAIDMARRHSAVNLIGVDLSLGASIGAARSSIPNLHFVRGNLLAPPLAKGCLDFIYSFGVLHHTPKPERAFHLLVERLRPGGLITVFVYKDFSDIPLKRLALRPVTWLRRHTASMAPKTLRSLSRLLAPLVYLMLALPARLLRACGAGRFARHIPYGIFSDLDAIASSLQDRFGAPYEFRFSSEDLDGWAARAQLVDARVVDCLPFGFSGLVISGRRADGNFSAPRQTPSSSSISA